MLTIISLFLYDKFGIFMPEFITTACMVISMIAIFCSFAYTLDVLVRAIQYWFFDREKVFNSAKDLFFYLILLAFDIAFTGAGAI